MPAPESRTSTCTCPASVHRRTRTSLASGCVDKDPAEAVKWFEQAANQGLAGSQTTLAMMYEQGNGVAQDMDKAKAWYAKAGF